MARYPHQRGWSNIVETRFSDHARNVFLKDTITNFTTDEIEFLKLEDIDPAKLDQNLSSVVQTIKSAISTPISSVVWTGSGAYSNIGDIEFHTDAGLSHAIELKASKKGGSGTEANMSGNALKKVSDEILGFLEHDHINGFMAQRHSVIGVTNGNQASFEAKLREHKYGEPELFKTTRKTLTEIARKGKVEYRQYLSNTLSAAKYKAKLVDFFNDIYSGHHTNGKTNHDMSNVGYFFVTMKWIGSDKFEFDVENRNLRVVDVNIDPVSLVNDNTGESVIFNVIFNDSTVRKYRLTASWGNLCQGGANPCFRVFSNKV